MDGWTGGRVDGWTGGRVDGWRLDSGAGLSYCSRVPAPQAVTLSRTRRGNHHFATRLSADAQRRRPTWHRAPSAARRAEIGIREARFLRCLAPDVVTEPEAGDVGAQLARRENVAGVRAQVQDGDARTRSRAVARPSRRAVAPDQLLARLLLRERGALPPLDPARAPRPSAAPTCRNRDARDASRYPMRRTVCNASRRPMRSGAFEACRCRR